MFDYTKYISLSGLDEKLKYLKECIDKADKAKNADEGLNLRYKYIRESTFEGDCFKAIIMFPEYMAFFDAHPECHAEHVHDFMFAFKWIIEDSSDFYQISIEQIESYFEEFKKRCEQYGKSLRPYYMKKMSFYEPLDLEKAKECRKLFKQSERDDISDCHACEVNDDIHFEIDHGSIHKALEYFKQMQEQNLTCGNVPISTYRKFTDYFTRNGNIEEAEYYAELLLGEGMEDIKTEANRVETLINLKLLTDPNLAFRIFCDYLSDFIKLRNPLEKLYFASASARFFDSLLNGEHTKIQAKFPVNFELYNSDNEYDIETLHNYFKNIAKENADKLDQRNGTSFYNDNYINFEYPAEPTNDFKFPCHGIVKREPAVFALPYKNESTLPSPKQIIEAFKSIPEIEFREVVDFDEESGLITICLYSSELEREIIYSFSVIEIPGFEGMTPIHEFKDGELERVNEEYSLAIVVSFTYEKGFEEEMFNMALKFLTAANTDNSPVIVNVTNSVLLSSKWAKIQAESDTAPLSGYMFRIHSYISETEDGKFEMATSGLNQLGSKEIMAVSLDEDDLDFAFKVISQAAEYVVNVSSLHDEGEKTDFGVVYDQKSRADFSWTDESKLFEKAVQEPSNAVLKLHIGSDKDGKFLNEISAEDREKLEFRTSNIQNSIDYRLSNSNFKYAYKAFERIKKNGEECELIVGFDSEIPEEFEDEYGYSSEIYVKITDKDGEFPENPVGIIDSGIEEINSLKKGVQIEAAKEDIFFWRLEINGEYYFCDDAYLLDEE